MEDLHCTLQIRLAKDKIFFGPGVLSLLKFTEKHESLNAAAKNMNLSYSKASKMIKGAEKNLGFKLLDRKIGGTGGGGSTLTPECTQFLKTYEEFEYEINTLSNSLFAQLFDEYI